MKYEKIAFGSGLITVALGVLAVGGWILGWSEISSFGAKYVPMAPNTAILFMVIGGSLMLAVRRPAKRFVRPMVVGTFLFSTFLSLATLAEFMANRRLGIDELFIDSMGTLGLIPRGHMSPITASLFLLANSALVAFLYQFRKAASLLGSFVILLGGVVLLGYLYGTPLLYGGAFVPVAFPTALAFVILGIGFVFAAGPGAWPLNSITGPSTRARLLRALLPVIFVIMLIGDWVSAFFFMSPDSRIVLASAVTLVIVMIILYGAVAQVSRVIGNAIDWSDAERRRSEQLYHTLTEAVPVGIFRANPAGDCVFVNEAWVSMSGISAAEAMGKGWIQVIHHEDRERVIKEWQSAAQLRLECRFQRPDGSVIWVFGKSMPEIGENGEITGFVGAITDITEHRRSAEEKERLQKQLIQAEKMSAVGNLAGGIAHELNNPMTTILGTTQLLLQETDNNSKLYKDLETIESMTQRCKNIVHALLTYSFGKELEFRKLDAVDVLNRAISLMGKQMELANIKINRVNMNESREIMGIDFQLEQLFLNIIVNAFEAMPRGGALTISIAASRQALEIAFADTGCGIVRANLTRVFDPFYTTKREGNMGLGLYICAQIVQKHKGSIRVESREGEGSVFCVILPNTTTI